MLFERLKLKHASLLLIAYSLCFLSCGSKSSLQSIIPDLAQTDSIQISDEWTGLSRVAPIEANYSLARSGEGFSGEAKFSVAGYSEQTELTASEAVAIPATATETFLKTLSSLTLKEGKYVPKIEHTDDYPSISIELKLKTDAFRVFTKSQGEGHAPWGVEFKGKTYIVESDAPAKALTALEPYLKRDVLQKLIEQKRAEAK